MDFLPLFGTIALAIVVIIAIVGFVNSRTKGYQKKDTTIAKHSDFKYEEFIKALGRLENIKSIDCHQSRVLLELLDYDIVDTTALKNIGVSGIVKTTKKITLVIGSRASAVSKYIETKLTK